MTCTTPYLALAPQGSGDWSRLAAACAEMAYRGCVWMLPGSWSCDSKETLVNGSWLRATAGVHVTSTLTTSDPPGAQDASLFYAFGGAGSVMSALAVAAAPGDKVITVVDDSLYTVGDQVLLRHQVVTERRCLREVVAIVGDTLVLDRPLLRPYAVGTELLIVPGARDIVIDGGCLLYTSDAADE